MAEHEDAPSHPVAPRLRDGPKKPHVGPSIHDYKQHHSLTVGPHSDHFWEKVSKCLFLFISLDQMLSGAGAGCCRGGAQVLRSLTECTVHMGAYASLTLSSAYQTSWDTFLDRQYWKRQKCLRLLSDAPAKSSSVP